MPNSIEHIARTLHALMTRRAVEHGIIHAESVVCWENEQEACREDWRAAARVAREMASDYGE